MGFRRSITRREPGRGGVASTRPSSSTCLTVSLIAVPGAAAPWRSAAAIARATRSSLQGPHAVVDEHDVVPPRRPGPRALDVVFADGLLLPSRSAARVPPRPPSDAPWLARRGPGSSGRMTTVTAENGKLAASASRAVDDKRAPGAAEILLRPISAEPHAAAAGDD